MEPTDQSLDENELFALRKAKLDALRGHRARHSRMIFAEPTLRMSYKSNLSAATKAGLAETKAACQGRGSRHPEALNGQGQFFNRARWLRDGFNLYVTRQGLGDAAYENFKSVDIGDIVGAEGVLMKTMKGELSLAVSQIRMLTKSSAALARET